MVKKMSDLTLEKLKISDRLIAVEKSVIRFEEIFKAHLTHDELLQKQMVSMIKTHEEIMMGKDGKPGLIIAIDRLNQSEKRRDWTVKAIMVATIGLIVKAVAGIFHLKT